MYHVTCELPNASEKINGITFEIIEYEEGPDGVVKVQTVDPVSRETAMQFHGIPGYTIDAVEGHEPIVAAAAPARRVVVAETQAKRGRGRPRKDQAPPPAAGSQTPPAATQQAAAPTSDPAPAAADAPADPPQTAPPAEAE